jgi:gas vesicle protein
MRLVSLLFVAGFGYLAGTLLAPKKGTETREDIWARISGCDAGRSALEKGKELRDAASEKLQKASESINQTKEVTLEKGRALRAVANEGLNKASESLNEIKNVAVDTKNELKDIAEDSLNKASDSISHAKSSASENVAQLNKDMQSLAKESKKILSDT